MATKTKKSGRSRAEEKELEKTYQKTAGKYAKPQTKTKKQRNGWVIAICILIPLLLLGACGYYFFFMYEPDDGLILQNITVAGVDVGGMTPEQAYTAVEQGVADTYGSQPLVVTIVDEQLELTPELTGFTLDVQAAVDAAYAYGRTGNKVQRKEEQLLAATSGIDTDITPFMTVNEAAIRTQLDSMNISASAELIPTTWEVTGEAPDLHADEKPAQLQNLVVTMGSPSYAFDRDDVIRQIVDSYVTGELSITCDCNVTEPEKLDLSAIYEACAVSVADAQLDKETFEVTPHTYGYRFDLEGVMVALEEAEYGQTLEFPFLLTEPTVYTTDLSSLLFRDVLSSYESYQASTSDRATNMQIACEKINGTILLPGDVFSFNGVVGERTKAGGYKPAPTYEGGKTVYTYGGGICQPSSTIYYCALLADLEIVERDCHSYPSVYVPWGMDATVYWGSLDFKFRNNTDYPIRIDASADDKGTVSIALVGTDTRDTYVKMESEVIGYYPHKVVEVPFTSTDNPKGYTDGQVITSPVDGYKVRTYRCRYDKETNELIEKIHEDDSVYSAKDKEVAVQTDKPTEPEPTEPPATEPTTPTDPPVIETLPPETEPPATEPPATDPPPADPPAEG